MHCSISYGYIVIGDIDVVVCVTHVMYGTKFPKVREYSFVATITLCTNELHGDLIVT